MRRFLTLLSAAVLMAGLGLAPPPARADDGRDVLLGIGIGLGAGIVFDSLRDHDRPRRPDVVVIDRGRHDWSPGWRYDRRPDARRPVYRRAYRQGYRDGYRDGWRDDRRRDWRDERRDDRRYWRYGGDDD